MLLKHVFLTYEWTHANLICELYEFFFKPVCMKFMFIKTIYICINTPLDFYFYFVYIIVFLLIFILIFWEKSDIFNTI
jgi:hypothetical protein